MALMKFSLVTAILAIGLGITVDSFGEESWVVVVRAGDHDRVDTPVRIDLNAAPGAETQARVPSLATGPKPFLLKELSQDGKTLHDPIVAQIETLARESGPPVRLTWILKGMTAAGTERRFKAVSGQAVNATNPWTLSDPTAGPLVLKNRDRPFFQYNTRPVSHPDYPPIQTRDAYLHPAYTPSGALITGDFSRHHPHHRGIFLAYTKTQVGSDHPDFWNIQSGSGKVVFDRLDRAETGPVTARIESRHRWEAKGRGTVLNERWQIEAYDIPDSPYWVFDLTATQQATGASMELLPYRYGGMAYRGPEPFVKGPLDVLTSEGRNRLGGDQKPTRWVDLTGPVEEGSDRYGGAMILDHPSNVNHPTVARIHPILLPFFCYVPGHDVKVSIGSGEPTVFRYRVVIHDGRPDSKLNQRLWRDFAEPPVVVVESKAASR
ncbi:PmoA family protein [Singulisphaera sp. Ch08]|uniref:PmoA family protein n=1 Tax=Singulisphaera sp. Ch08 TaxID=3120278 RepID=A0AAU7C6X9_9BACT